MQSLIVQLALIEPTALLLCPLSANVVQTNMIAAVIADKCFVAVSPQVVDLLVCLTHCAVHGGAVGGTV